jgi:hypothetical protein
MSRGVVDQPARARDDAEKASLPHLDGFILPMRPIRPPRNAFSTGSFGS